MAGAAGPMFCACRAAWASASLETLLQRHNESLGAFSAHLHYPVRVTRPLRFPGLRAALLHWNAVAGAASTCSPSVKSLSMQPT